MSDGPHKSLPLRRHWKKFAERAATPSFSPSEVAAALPNALLNDFREAPMAQVFNIFLGDGQISLFHEDCADLLEAVRSCCRGAVGNILIDCAIEANVDGLTGDLACKTALENALEAYARGTCRSIEEHYKRKESRSVANVRDRLKGACSQISFATLASEMMSDKTDRTGQFHLIKRTGIDEGPQL